MPEPYVLLLIGFGLLILLTAWLPMLLSEAPLSLPIFCLGIGATMPLLPFGISIPGLSGILPLIERTTELTVIIALMGAGLKIDRKVAWQSWMLTWRLLAFVMPLTILALTWLGQFLLGLGVAASLLMAAALAPTDPVLASDVQVGPPKSGAEDETRFALTSEAGLNDGLAFPFVMCAIAIASADHNGGNWFWHWLSVDVAWRLVAGMGTGIVVGSALGWLVFRLPNRAKLSRTGDGFVALGVTVIVYGLAEAAHGYGFVAVFVSALALRAVERDHDYHEKLHDFAEQLERLLMMVVLVLFGASLTGSNLLSSLTWQSGLYALIAIFLVRPVIAWLCLWKCNCSAAERGAISFFGIRGIGSIYYLGYAFQKGSIEPNDVIWSTVAFTILISIILHGTTVTPVMRLLDRRRQAGATRLKTRKLA